MKMEDEVAVQINRMQELHEDFSKGNFKEMNEYYAEDFQGWLYMPGDDNVHFFNASQIKQGNENAAAYYKGEDIKFNYAGLQIIQQSENQAAVSYKITHQHKDKIVQALSLEVWRK